MGNDPSNMDLSLDETLVAYLDGELAPESRRRVEELLARDPQVRRRLQEMEQTWELLDDLDAAPVDNQFTQSTLEMVAVAARRDVDQSMAEAPRRRWRRALTIGVALLTAAATGYGVVTLLMPDANRQLLQDLPVLETLDQYRQINDIVFLRMLRDENLFPKDSGEVSQELPASLEESLEQRRERIEQMSPEEKQQLLQFEERFTAMDYDEQQRLRRLHEAIQNAPNAQELRQVMRRYCEWLKTLSLSPRMELAELEPGKRIRAVKRQLREGGRRLGSEDLKVLWRWINDCAARHEKQFIENLPEGRRKELAKLSPADQHRIVIRELGRRWQSAGPNRPPPMMTEDDLARLRAELSPESRQHLESLPMGKQWRQVAEWIYYAVRQRHAPGLFSAAADQRLADFFEKELSDVERDQLLSLPGDEMQRELLTLYLRRTKPPTSPTRRPSGVRGQRPGAQRPKP